ncbi:MAG: hypothetical protein ABJJ05_15220 [Maribacter litoralis]|uniref:hypothetical protein n=1 Tax=Maribacter litoralis TaxID=2059726 RepID=UPI003297F628
MKQARNTLKNYFKTGDYPTEAQFSDVIDSFLNITEDEVITNIVDNGNNSFTFQLLSGGTVTIDVGSSGIGGTVGENQVAFGNDSGEAQGTNEFRFDGESLVFTGTNSDRYLRFAETNGQYNGAFMWYEGSANKFHIGVHPTGDADKVNDQKSLTVQRSNGFVGIFKDTPIYELDMEGTLCTTGARIAPTFANFTNRIAIVNPSFGSTRLGDSALQSPSIDTQVLHFRSDTGQVSNFSMFENNNVLTVRSGGGDFVGVLDFNGAYQADYGNDSAEATLASTIRFDNGFGYVNDVGVQRYLPGNSVVAQSFFDVMINSGGAPRMQHVKTYYDGNTYDVIRTIETDGRMVHEKTVEFKLPTIGADAVNNNELVTKSQMDTAIAASGGVGGIGGTIGDNQIAIGNSSGEAEGSDDFRFDGESLVFKGTNSDRYLRFAETNGQYNGAFIWYEGAANKLHIGVHAAGDTNKANDSKSLTILRSNGFVGLFKDNPIYEFDMEGTFKTTGARIAPTFADFTNRISIINPSFGGSRLGDSALQSPSLDTQLINFMSDTGQVSNFSMFENNNVLTIRSGGSDKVAVLDFNGAHQADYANDSAEATVASTIRYDNGYGYVNDAGVQRYLPGSSVVAQSFFDVLINSGGAPRMKHIKTYYDGTTYDVIRTIETNGKMVHEKVVEFKEPTIGVDAINENELVTKGQMDIAVASIPSGTTAERPATGIIAGSQFFDTSIGKPIWYSGSNWVDALGATV